jgi:hypothetical protein
MSNLGVTFYGNSLSSPARLSTRKQHFIRDLLRSTFPTVDAGAFVVLVRSEAERDYPDGSNSMPRHPIGGELAFAGRVGADLVIGIGAKSATRAH